MESIVFEVRLADDSLRHVVAWFSDNEAVTEGCDACIGWTMYDPDTRREIDGGEMDYDSAKAGYVTIGDTKDDLVDYIGEDFGAPVVSSRLTGLDPKGYGA